MSKMNVQVFQQNFADFSDLLLHDTFDVDAGNYYEKMMAAEERPKEIIPAKFF